MIPGRRSATARGYRAKIPDARLVRVENASHWIPHDTPEIFAEEVGGFFTRG